MPNTSAITHCGHEEDDIIFHLNLNSERPDLKPLLAELEPTLRKVLETLERNPDPGPGCHDRGYHNITYTKCKHP